MGLESVIYNIGVISSLYFLGLVAQHVYIFVRPSSLPRYLHGGSNSKSGASWALVTGATDGIGLGFAQELCSHGFNVILHGRNKQKLLRVQEQLKLEYPTSKTRTVIFDAGSNDQIDDQIHEFGGDDDEINLTVLINNVGGMSVFPPESPSYPDLKDYTSSQVDSIINLNARFAAQLTRLLLPTLARNGPSLIMNISSSAAAGIPHITVYGGAKGFVESFTKSVKGEMVATKKDVDAIGIIVANVRSAANDAPLGFTTPSARRMARAALNRVGCGKMVVHGYWPHWLQTFVFDFLHEKVFQTVVIGAMQRKMVEADLAKKKK
jgi:17beta-estradiol 17-dehydrogenase / very-long-chain 3-oxoacyl-CoA reductase